MLKSDSTKKSNRKTRKRKKSLHKIKVEQCMNLLNSIYGANEDKLTLCTLCSLDSAPAPTVNFIWCIYTALGTTQIPILNF